MGFFDECLHLSLLSPLFFDFSILRLQFLDRGALDWLDAWVVSSWYDVGDGGILDSSYKVLSCIGDYILVLRPQLLDDLILVMFLGSLHNVKTCGRALSIV